MYSIEIVLTMLLAVVASGYLVRVVPVALPMPLMQIAMGAVIAGVFNHGVALDPQIFFLAFLPPLLFLDGWRIPKDGLVRDRNVILHMALGLVVFTVFGAGFLIHWLIPAMPLAVAFALAAIVAPTDPVAVSSITARVPIPRRLMHILEGESLLNDASGLVCFRFAVAAAMTGAFSLASASLTFVWVATAGLGIGAGFTLVVSYAQGWLSRQFGEEAGSPILVFVLLGEQLPDPARRGGFGRAKRPPGSVVAGRLCAHDQRGAGIAAIRVGMDLTASECCHRASARPRVEQARLAPCGSDVARGCAWRDHDGRCHDAAAVPAGRQAVPRT